MAELTRLRTRTLAAERWSGTGLKSNSLTTIGHRKCLDGNLPVKTFPQMTIKTVENHSNNQSIEQPGLCIYMDGSVMDGKAGYGWAAISDGLVVATESNPIGGEVHIFNAELIAIQSALLWLKENNHHLST